MSAEQNHSQKLIIFILCSLLLHFILLLILYFSPHSPKALFEEKEDKKVVWIDSSLVPPVVDIDKPALEKRPEKANKIAQYDSSVKKEQVAPTVKSPAQKALKPSQKLTAEKQILQKEKTQSSLEVEKNAELKKEKPQNETPKKEEKTPTEATNKKLPDLSLKPQDLGKEIPKALTKNETPKIPPAPSLDFKSLDAGLAYGRSGSSNAQEFLPDYTIGGKTYLNAMKLQDVSYFVKMKRILKLRWNPIPSVRNYLMSEKIKVNRIECTVGISLDTEGKTTKMFMIKGSGVSAYDKEVLQTFKDSSPFSRPPEKYLKEGELNMSWTFTVYL